MTATKGLVYFWGTAGNLKNLDGPRRIEGAEKLPSFKSVFCSGDAFAAVSADDESLFLWGGNDKLPSTPTPLQKCAPSRWSSVSCGAASCVAVMPSKSKVFEFGAVMVPPVEGELLPKREIALPVGVAPLHVSCGAVHSLVVCEDGSLLAFGGNSSCQLGFGDKSDRDAAALVPGIEHVVSAAGGAKHSVAATVDGSVFWWGKGLEECAVPVPRPLGWGDITPVPPIARVACGDRHTLLVARDGSLFAFGNNSCGQLGVGDTVNRATPVRVGDIHVRVVGVAAGGGYGESHTLALTELGEVFSWGSAKHGQLGTGATENCLSPRQVVGLRRKAVVSVACAWLGSVALVNESPLEPERMDQQTGETLGLFSMLSEDVIRAIFFRLDGRSLARATQTNRAMRQLAGDGDVWKELIQRDFGHLPPGTPLQEHGTWKEKYAALYRRFHRSHVGFGTPAPTEPAPKPGWLKSLIAFRKTLKKVIVTGLDAAGKTTMLYRLAGGSGEDIFTAIPTIGFNVEEFKYKGLDLFAWDVGGEDKIRPLWRYYFQNSVALIFVIDSNDSERWDSVQREHLRTLEADELRGLPVLVFCNKQDLPMSLPAGEVAFRSGIEAFCVSHGNPFWFQPCSFAHGDESELTQAFRWLFAMISRGK